MDSILLVTGLVFIINYFNMLSYRKRRTKGKPEVTQNEIYLTTTKSQNAESSKPDYSNTNVLKRAISNDYVSDEDLEAARGMSTPNLSTSGNVYAGVDNKSMLKVTGVSMRNPTMEGSLRRGRLPELPTDGGYEIPVNLLGATNCKAATVQDETSGDAASGGKVVEEDQEDVEEDEPESTDVYQVIPVDDDAVEDANAVYKSIA